MSSNIVPKIIWQTHEWEYEDLPQNFLAASMTWQNLNPDWDYRYVGARERDQYVKETEPLLYKMYKKHDKTSQADLWRYLVTYQHGGVYADMDSICTMPQTYMLDRYQNDLELVTTPPENDDRLNNSNFAVIKSSKIIQKTLENIVSHYKKFDWYQMFVEAETEEDFWNDFVIGIKLHPGVYGEAVREYSDSVSFSYVGAIHSHSIKDSFNTDYQVTYQDKKMSYIELCAELGKKTYFSNG